MIEDKSKTVTMLLWLFLGGFSAHRFYLGNWAYALGFIFVYFFGIVTYVTGNHLGLFVIFGAVVWFVADGVYLLTRGRGYYARGNI